MAFGNKKSWKPWKFTFGQGWLQDPALLKLLNSKETGLLWVRSPQETKKELLRGTKFIVKRGEQTITLSEQNKAISFEDIKIHIANALMQCSVKHAEAIAIHILDYAHQNGFISEGRNLCLSLLKDSHFIPVFDPETVSITFNVTNDGQIECIEEAKIKSIITTDDTELPEQTKPHIATLRFTHKILVDQAAGKIVNHRHAFEMRAHDPVADILRPEKAVWSFNKPKTVTRFSSSYAQLKQIQEFADAHATNRNHGGIFYFNSLLNKPELPDILVNGKPFSLETIANNEDYQLALKNFNTIETRISGRKAEISEIKNNEFACKKRITEIKEILSEKERHSNLLQGVKSSDRLYDLVLKNENESEWRTFIPPALRDKFSTQQTQTREQTYTQYLTELDTEIQQLRGQLAAKESALKQLTLDNTQLKKHKDPETLEKLCNGKQGYKNEPLENLEEKHTAYLEERETIQKRIVKTFIETNLTRNGRAPQNAVTQFLLRDTIALRMFIDPIITAAYAKRGVTFGGTDTSYEFTTNKDGSVTVIESFTFKNYSYENNQYYSTHGGPMGTLRLTRNFSKGDDYIHAKLIAFDVSVHDMQAKQVFKKNLLNNEYNEVSILSEENLKSKHWFWDLLNALKQCLQCFMPSLRKSEPRSEPAVTMSSPVSPLSASPYVERAREQRASIESNAYTPVMFPVAKDTSPPATPPNTPAMASKKPEKQKSKTFSLRSPKGKPEKKSPETLPRTGSDKKKEKTPLSKLFVEPSPTEQSTPDKLRVTSTTTPVI